MAHLLVYLRGDDPLPVVRLETQRTTYPLYGDDGVHLADLADDRVSAQILKSRGCRTRTPVHSSGGNGNSNWCTEARTCSLPPRTSLRAAGARPATARVQAGKSTAWTCGAEARKERSQGYGSQNIQRSGHATRGPASELLAAYLDAQIGEILAHDPDVRLEQPEAVHDFRSATRRARSALAAYRRLYSAVAVRRLGTS